MSHKQQPTETKSGTNANTVPSHGPKQGAGFESDHQREEKQEQGQEQGHQTPSDHSNHSSAAILSAPLSSIQQNEARHHRRCRSYSQTPVRVWLLRACCVDNSVDVDGGLDAVDEKDEVGVVKDGEPGEAGGRAGNREGDEGEVALEKMS
jgi:hypothetical protein